MAATRSTAILILTSFVVIASKAKSTNAYFSAINNRPIIGVLSQELFHYTHGKYEECNYESYIAASYVKFLEGAGARVVPIWIGQKKAYYSNIMNKINGVLWPGGASNFDNSNGYAEAGGRIYTIAKQLNDNGNYFPIFGVCLGFELLTYLTANREKHRVPCDAERISLPLQFKPGFRNSRMYKDITDDIVDILENKNVTANFHKKCVTERSLRRIGILDKLKVLSVNTIEGMDVPFVSSVESTTYPFYGIQFHPEKNLYEWIDGQGIPHDKKAVRIAQYFADFFVNEARKNFNSFGSHNEETQSLIYNYPVTYTAQRNMLFEQCYMFKANKSTSIRY